MYRLVGVLYLLVGVLLAFLDWLLTWPAHACARLAETFLARAEQVDPDDPEPPVTPDV